jgi:hypothetical protein
LPLSDIRGWASAAEASQARDFAVIGFAHHVLQLFGVAVGRDKAARERYFAWLTDRILNQIAHSEPEMHAWLLARVRELLVNGVADAMKAMP